MSTTFYNTFSITISYGKTYQFSKRLPALLKFWPILKQIYIERTALCQMLGYSPYESSLAPIIVMVGAILFAQK